MDQVALEGGGPGVGLAITGWSSDRDRITAEDIRPCCSPATGMRWQQGEGAGICEPHLRRGRRTVAIGKAAAEAFRLFRFAQSQELFNTFWDILPWLWVHGYCMALSSHPQWENNHWKAGHVRVLDGE
ncbi:hypothetical protein NDU88_001215 [Pleurodeles waltl]|uniref:Uncharacterized protein n=1 Tax=Pleurodeles waltl TaxID=8319 RepID=A0AAV7ML49_PLEWA|nr:hypothetical protein NDU88_001215 [Pleurodeles waltl]